MKDLINKIKNVVYKGLRFLNQCQHANKIYFKVVKTEVIIFRRKIKQFDFHLNLKLCR